jgi:hypothetical protein
MYPSALWLACVQRNPNPGVGAQVEQERFLVKPFALGQQGAAPAPEGAPAPADAQPARCAGARLRGQSEGCCAGRRRSALAEQLSPGLCATAPHALVVT